MKVDERLLEEFLKNFRVVTPVDLNRSDVKLRRDIVKKKLDDIKKEAPDNRRLFFINENRLYICILR